MDLIWEQVVVDAHNPVALGRWWADALGWVVVGDAADEFEIRPTAKLLMKEYRIEMRNLLHSAFCFRSPGADGGQDGRVLSARS
jgi:hypothetical protein